MSGKRQPKLWSSVRHSRRKDGLMRLTWYVGRRAWMSIAVMPGMLLESVGSIGSYRDPSGNTWAPTVMSDGETPCWMRVGDGYRTGYARRRQ